MPVRFERPCRERGCSERTRDASGYCELHQKDNSFFRLRQARSAEEKKNNPVWKLYYCVAWHRFCDAFDAYNMLCQRIVDGQRCRRPIEIHHHIISPKENRGLMYTASNVVGVCRQHHPPTEGEPKENLARLDQIYVPTIWKEIKF